MEMRSFLRPESRKQKRGTSKFGRRWNPKKKELERRELRYSGATGTVRVNYLLEETDLMYNNFG
jgi:hypothetical protein